MSEEIWHKQSLKKRAQLSWSNLYPPGGVRLAPEMCDMENKDEYRGLCTNTYQDDKDREGGPGVTLCKVVVVWVTCPRTVCIQQVGVSGCSSGTSSIKSASPLWQLAPATHHSIAIRPHHFSCNLSKSELKEIRGIVCIIYTSRMSADLICKLSSCVTQRSPKDCSLSNHNFNLIMIQTLTEHEEKICSCRKPHFKRVHTVPSTTDFGTGITS